MYKRTSLTHILWPPPSNGITMPSGNADIEKFPKAQNLGFR